jgi:hypothetical protein
LLADLAPQERIRDWRAAIRFADVPTGYPGYQAASVAVASGVLEERREASSRRAASRARRPCRQSSGCAR